MKKKRGIRIIWPIVTFVFDTLAIAASIIAAYKIRFHPDILSWLPPGNNFIPPFKSYIAYSLISGLIIVFIFLIRGVYRLRWREGLFFELTEVFWNYFFGFAVLFALMFFYRDFSFSRLLAIISLILGFFILLFTRTLLFHIRRKVFHTRPPHKVLILGENTEVVGRRLDSAPQTGFQLLRKLEDGDCNMPLEKISKTVSAYEVDTVVFSYGFDHFYRVREVIETLEGKGLRFLFVPDPLGLITWNIRSVNISGLPMLKMRERPLTGVNSFVKRTFDFIVSAILLILLSPVLLLLALAVKLSSRGPVIYKQERVSLDGNTFTLYKFRSMRIDAEKETGPVWSSKDDNRKTKVGEFIRRWSLDELPQLWNVFIGDMSLVGPRPERPFFVEQFKAQIPRYHERHQVRCGLTGWAQANGLRGQTPIEDRTRYDLFYVENWSLGFDIRILFMTVLAVITGSDAY